MKINIVGGSGDMGKIHRPLFEAAGHDILISGRTSIPTMEDATRMSDLTIVSVPLSATRAIIQKVAPHASALMDFTSLKQFPLDAMLQYTTSSTEVGGLHPLYGNVSSLEGRTVVYCSTSRSGKKCNEILEAFRRGGVCVKEMKPFLHDLHVNAIGQNARTMLFASFGLLSEKYELTMEELYEISPPPTRILIDLLARQIGSPKQDELYTAMLTENLNTSKIRADLTSFFYKITNSSDVPYRIRTLYGEDFLNECQERAKQIIEKYLQTNI